MTDWAISLHPQHWQAIVDGVKRYELRRRLPNIATDDRFHVYVTRPVQKVVGTFRNEWLLKGTPDQIWRVVQDDISTTYAEYSKYFEGSPTAYAITIVNVRVLLVPVTPWFSPPQYVTRLSTKDVSPFRHQLDL